MTALLLCLLGLAASTYLTYEHYSGSGTLACPDSGAIDCVKVTTSSYSELLGVPVALLGLLFFGAMAPLLLPAAWRSGKRWLRLVRTASVAGAVLFMVYLVWAELFRIDAVCLWCTAVHAVTLALFAVVVLAEAGAEPGADGRTR